MWLFLYFLSIYFENCMSIGIVPSSKINESLQVETKNGLVQGSERQTINGKTYFSYVGIPYARPPINDLRFKSPKRMPKWSGVLDATVKGPCCAGLNVSHLTKGQLLVRGKEDCLYLNVYTPKTTNKDNISPLAVMVYFYGGAFISGCGNEQGPDFFIENDVILVVPNFRLSIFGYLSTEDMECPGNWASKDQIAILKWIQTNIRKFDGDPNRVTIFGESAGAINVSVLLLSLKAKGLFHRVIMMSGASLSYWAYQTQHRKIAFDVGVALGIETNSSKVLLDKLRKMDTNFLIQGQIAPIVLNLFLALTNGLPLSPSIEPIHKEALITEYPYGVLEKGNFNRVPVMIGVTSSEGVLFLPLIRTAKPFMMIFNLSPGLLIRMTKNFKNRTIAAGEMLNHFLNTTDILNAKEEDIVKFVSEDGYFRPSRKTSSLISKYSPVYFYQFSYEGLLGLELLKKYHALNKTAVRNFKGVSHTEDISYLFIFEDIELEFYMKDMKICKKLSKIYTNFAKTGNPTPFRDPFLDNVTWPKITPEKFPYVNLKQYFTEERDNFNEQNFQFWEGLFSKYGEKPYKLY